MVGTNARRLEIIRSVDIFYALLDVVYFLVGGEELGVIAIGLSALLALLIGYYLWFIDRRSGGVLPEDNDLGEIADSAGDLGFYSPHSWWPLPLGLSICTVGLGLIIGWWLTIIGVGALLISVIGFSLEYEKPTVSTH